LHQTQGAGLHALQHIHHLVYGLYKAICLFRSEQWTIIIWGVMVMESRKLEKNLIFYVPGQSGAIFTYKAGNLINDEIFNNTMETLALEVDDPIQHIEERRFKPREIV
jgi:hypothetical protein